MWRLICPNGKSSSTWNGKRVHSHVARPVASRRQVTTNVINLRPNSLFCRKISSIHHHLKESEMNSVPAVPTTDQAVLPKII